MSGYRLVLTAQIAHDIEEAISYTFDNFGEKTALKFIGALEATEDMLAASPYMTKIFDEELQIRSFALPRYPFTLFVRINDDMLEVIALAMTSTSRDPKLIRDLVRKRVTGSEA